MCAPLLDHASTLLSPSGVRLDGLPDALVADSPWWSIEATAATPASAFLALFLIYTFFIHVVQFPFNSWCVPRRVARRDVETHNTLPTCLPMNLCLSWTALQVRSSVDALGGVEAAE